MAIRSTAFAWAGLALILATLLSVSMVRWAGAGRSAPAPHSRSKHEAADTASARPKSARLPPSLPPADGSGITYRSALSADVSPHGGNPPQASARGWEEGDAGAEEEHRRLAELLRRTSSRDEALDMIDRAFDLPSKSVVEAASAALDHSDASVRLAVTEHLAGFSDPAALGPLLARALEDPSAEVRLAALPGAVRQGGNVTVDLLKQALRNDNLDVRQNALDFASHLQAETYQRLLVEAVSSPFEDIGMSSLRAAGPVLSKSNVGPFLSTLSSPFPSVRSEAQALFEERFLQEFQDTETALEWWSRNEHRFDDDLVEVLPNPDLVTPGGG